MNDLAGKLAGKFIVLDGPDGSGKTTQLGMLGDRLASRGAAVERVCDPGGTPVGDRIRAILLEEANGHIAARCEMMLFMASRAQLIEQRIRPALAAGKVVLCDRFISATVAYQGASGLEAGSIIEVGNVAVGGLWPDLTIVLDLPAETGLRRVGRRAGANGAADRMEARGLGYHQSVRQNFLALAQRYPKPVAYVSAEATPQAVFTDVLAVLEGAFAK